MRIHLRTAVFFAVSLAVIAGGLWLGLNIRRIGVLRAQLLRGHSAIELLRDKRPSHIAIHEWEFMVDATYNAFGNVATESVPSSELDDCVSSIEATVLGEVDEMTVFLIWNELDELRPEYVVHLWPTFTSSLSPDLRRLAEQARSESRRPRSARPDEMGRI